MKIKKSTRHSKIIGEFGEFGEYAICNWLSRCGFEVIRVDHTGLDIIAYDPHKDQRLGITVKSRTRAGNKEADAVNIFKKKDDRKKLEAACKAFACEPWIGIYVETQEYADIYLTSLENYDKKYCGSGQTINVWKMTKASKDKYNKDPNVQSIQINFHDTNWFRKQVKNHIGCGLTHPTTNSNKGRN